MRALACLAVAVAIAACGGGGSSDPVDASPPDSDPACGEWTVVPAVGTNVRAFDPSPIALGRTTRIAFEVDLTGCERTGTARYTLDLEDATATIAPYNLRQIGGTCTDSARTVTRVVDVILPAAGTWTVSLNAGGSVSVDVDPAPATACDPTRIPCQTDCDCDDSIGERCIGVMQGVPTTVCARLCEADRDCAGMGRCTGDAPGGTPYACDTQVECDAGHVCPDGFTCNAGACIPSFTLSQTSRHECDCDSDCDAGLHCVRPYDGSQPNRCQAMCETDGPWCQGPHVCTGLGEDVSGLAGTDSVCGWIGD